MSVPGVFYDEDPYGSWPPVPVRYPCWADACSHAHECGREATTDVGLCRWHYLEIFGSPCPDRGEG